MATVKTLESSTNFFNFPTSGSGYAASQTTIEWGNAGQVQWIWTVDPYLGTVKTIFIDTNDVTVKFNIQITDLSFTRSSTYWDNLLATGSLYGLLSDLLSGNDIIFGDESQETLVGFEGNDILIGDGSGDDLYGENGNDTASYQTSETAVLASLLNPASNTGVDAAGDQYFSIQNLIGSKFGDTLEGDASGNRLTGGLGRDTLIGNGGPDVFDFNSVKETKKGSARDEIVDFSRGQNDHIDLKTIDAKKGVSGNNKFNFIGKSDFHDKKGELRYEDKGFKVIVQGDVNGDGKADFEILLNVGSLSKGDFVL